MVTLVPEIVPRLNRLTWLGWTLVVLGLLAMVSPLVAGKATVILVGLILLIAGLAQLLNAFQANPNGASRLLTFVTGAITATAAVFVLAHPMLGLQFLTFLLLAYLIGEGLWKLVLSLRNLHAPGQLWLLLSGALSLLVGFLIWRQWPLAGSLALGILVGLNLLGTGIALLVLTGSMKQTLRKAIFVVPGGKT
jgi:uncharacterized membrane protein HdeD (DUF308 family)